MTLAILSSTLYGIAVYIIVNIYFAIASATPAKENLNLFETERRAKLRTLSQTYANAEYIVAVLVAYFKKSKKLKEIENALRIVENGIFWKPEEYLAVIAANAAFAAGGTFAFFLILSFLSPEADAALTFLVWGGILALCVFAAIDIFSVQSLKEEAKKKKNEIRYQLPYIVDLLVLGQGAGASFNESIKMIVAEAQNAVVRQEFAIIQEQLDKGRPLPGVLENFAKRYQDRDVSDLVNAIVKSLNLGVPLIKTLLEYVDQMRLKRTQWAKKIITQGETKIIFPTIIMLVGGIILILAPFVVKIAEELSKG